jgi:peroxiredoxin
MKKMLALLTIVLLYVGSMYAQSAPNPQDLAAIKQTALDYAEGWYSGDAGRMERAIHYDLNKAFPRYIAKTGRTAFSYTTYSQLIEYTTAKLGVLADTGWHLDVKVIDVNDNVANAKVTSARFNDYLQIINMDGKWKIVNVLWNGGPANLARIQGFKADEERAAIEQAAMMYADGIAAGDAKRVETVIDPDFCRVNIGTAGQSGKQVITRQRNESMIENVIAGVGKMDEVYRDYKVKIIDIMDGLAVVRADFPATYEYLQMFKSGDEWKIFNSIVKPNATRPLEPLLPAIVGEPMFNFTLPVYGGGEFTLSDHRGKNVMLMFPRGWLGNAWCSYCQYQYIELADLEKTSAIREKYNLDIVFVLPYNSEKIADWFETMPEAAQGVEGLKTPAPTAGRTQKEYSEWVKKHFPKKYEVNKEEIRKAFPVLLDEQRTLSKQLKIFTKFWDGNSSEQNIASVYIIDKNGILKMKYNGQMTEDRPSTDYLLEVIRKLE